ncbi:helix-turn-helix domain-containing protein, partial [Cytobacillus firmus]|uniref:helix-turn-helix domain-containing protein n=1 Tax=Cytobacillus firmus TaxID=1399 RepID=UPI003B9F13EB
MLFLDEKATKRSAVVTPAFSTLANKEYTTTILTNTEFKVAQIAKELKISRPTVYKYLDMTLEEAKAYTERPH